MTVLTTRTPDAKVAFTAPRLLNIVRSIDGGGFRPPGRDAISTTAPLGTWPSALEEAIAAYRNVICDASIFERFELSIRSMLMHVILEETTLVPSALVEEVAAVTASRKRELKEQVANIEAFEARLRFLFTGFEEPTTPTLSDEPGARDVYWTRVRGDLQQWFSLSLSDLADIIGIAKATLVYINHPGRRPRPSTTRKVMDLHALGSAMVGALGIERGRNWLATTGLSGLRAGGIEQLDRTVAQALYGRRPSEEATAFGEPGDEADLEPYGPSNATEAEAF